MHRIRALDLDRIEETRRALDAFARRVRERLPVERIILFGSFAAGNAHEGSDIDLLVIGRFEERFLDRGLRVVELNDEGLPVQAFCYTPDEVRLMGSSLGSFVAEALRTGREI